MRIAWTGWQIERGIERIESQLETTLESARCPNSCQPPQLRAVFVQAEKRQDLNDLRVSQRVLQVGRSKAAHAACTEPQLRQETLSCPDRHRIECRASEGRFGQVTREVVGGSNDCVLCRFARHGRCNQRGRRPEGCHQCEKAQALHLTHLFRLVSEEST